MHDFTIMWFLLGILSALLLGCYDVSQKRALRNWDVIPVIFLSTLFSSLLLGLMLLCSRFGLIVEGSLFYVPVVDLRTHALIFLKSALVLSSWLCSYTAIKHLPLTVVTPINATRPMWTLVGALLLFGEQLNAWQWAGVGVALLSFYAFSVVDKLEGIHFTRNKYIWCVLIGTTLGAFSGLYDKHLMRQFDHNAVQAYYTFYQCLMMGIVWMVNRNMKKEKGKIIMGSLLPIMGISVFLTLADFAYLLALSYPDSLISVLSTVRRAGAVVPFTYGIFVMKDQNPRYKTLCMLGVLLGMLFLFLGTR